MKKIFTLMLLGFALQANAQFKLTPNGFVSMADSSKSYVVLNVDGKTQADLYKKSLVYINKMYVSPKDVLSTVDGESITINGVSKTGIRRTSMHTFANNYTISFEYKDGKIKVNAPSFRLSSYAAGHPQEMHLIYSGVSLDGSDFGIYNKKGELKYEKAKLDLESFFNSYITDIQTELQKKQEDW